jgi:hypothetical protein
MKQCKEGNELELLLKVISKPNPEPFVLLVLNVLHRIVITTTPQHQDDTRHILLEVYSTTTNRNIAANINALLLLLKHEFDDVDDIIHFLMYQFVWCKLYDRSIW